MGVILGVVVLLVCIGLVGVMMYSEWAEKPAAQPLAENPAAAVAGKRPARKPAAKKKAARPAKKKKK